MQQDTSFKHMKHQEHSWCSRTQASSKSLRDHLTLLLASRICLIFQLSHLACSFFSCCLGNLSPAPHKASVCSKDTCSHAPLFLVLLSLPASLWPPNGVRGETDQSTIASDSL